MLFFTKLSVKIRSIYMYQCQKKQIGKTYYKPQQGQQQVILYFMVSFLPLN